MKFTMFEKETKDEKYRTNPYRITNFNRDEQGNFVCPNGKKFIYKYDRHIRGNKYGRTEAVYECEDCEGCPYRSECCKRETGNRTARLNRELTSFHEEVINNLETIHGAFLCMNRSIQSEDDIQDDIQDAVKSMEMIKINNRFRENKNNRKIRNRMAG